jgi:hypothetical protein
MTSDDKINELEQKFALLEQMHLALEQLYFDNVGYLTRRVAELQSEVDKLSALVPDFAAVEKLALDAYTASSDAAQQALMEVDRVVPLDMQHEVYFNQLPTMREAREQFVARRRN